MFTGLQWRSQCFIHDMKNQNELESWERQKITYTRYNNKKITFSETSEKMTVLN